MHPRFLEQYNTELRFIREMGREFAEAFPKIAGRLSLDGLECADPYVERLLEGFAFLSARVQLKLDAQFPRFARHLLERVYPHYLAPTPSMAVVQMQPDFAEPDLKDGVRVPRHTQLRSLVGKSDSTGCAYRTAWDVELWPIQIESARYLGSAAAVQNLGVPNLPELRAGIQLRLRTAGGIPFGALDLQRLPFYLKGSDSVPFDLYEQIIGCNIGAAVCPASGEQRGVKLLPRDAVRQIGFSPEEALIPYGARSFDGYRLLQEYFACPHRFLFFSLEGLRTALEGREDGLIDLVILLNRSSTETEKLLSKENFALYCSPVVNLFSKRTDRVHIENRFSEYHVVVDRTRPMDYEIFSIEKVTGFGKSINDTQEFHPFYAFKERHSHQGEAYYVQHRVPRVLSSGQRIKGPRSHYVGTEVYLSLVDPREAPFRTELRELGVEALCTNRDLPIQISLGQGPTDFTWDIAAPLTSIRVLTGPTRPRAPAPEGESSWRLINHLQLNYLSLLNSDGGAQVLREMLRLYCAVEDKVQQRMIDEGVVGIRHQPVHRRLPIAGPIAFGRGLQIELTVADAAFEGNGAFVFSAVLERFFAKYVSVNHFTETRAVSLNRGEIMRWPIRIGNRKLA